MSSGEKSAAVPLQILEEELGIAREEWGRLERDWRWGPFAFVPGQPLLGLSPDETNEMIAARPKIEAAKRRYYSVFERYFSARRAFLSHGR